MPAEASLRIGSGLSLPIEAVTEALAVLGRRGSGKTSTAVVLAEEMLAAGQQVVVVDPTGAWWGLRANADGSPNDLPVVIVGGEHADLTLEEGAGRALAKLLVQTRQSAVLDLSGLSKAGARRLMADFLEDLYRFCRDPLHLVVDEADLFAPQRMSPDVARLLGAMEDVVRRGRQHGLGVTLITQRPAVLNKNVLAQAEVLVALRLTSPRDVAAIDEWVRLHAEDDQAREVKKTLAGLPVGTAWVWSPGWLEILQQVQVRPRRTFDSSATPKPGVVRPSARLGANLEVAALRERLAELVAAGKPAPKQPKRAGQVGPAIEVRPDAQVATLQQEVRRLSGELERARAAATIPAPTLSKKTASMLRSLAGTLARAAEDLNALLAEEPPSGPLAPKAAGARAQAASPEGRTATADSRRVVAVPPAVAAPGAVTIKAGARRMLAAMASYYPLTLTRAQLASFAQVKRTGGTYGSYLSMLKANDLISETDGRLSLTAGGLAAVGGVPSTPITAAELRDQLRSAVKAGARRMFDVLAEAYPDTVSRSDLAAAAEIEMSGGTFGSYLSTLRTNEIVDVVGQEVRMQDWLFTEPDR